MKVLVCDGVADEAVSMLREHFDVEMATPSHDELREMISPFDAVIVRGRTKVTEDVIERGGRLKVIARAGVGVDNIDLDAASKRKIPVVNAPTGATTSVAELTIGLMIALARHISLADASMKDGKWLKRELVGVELRGKVLGLVGIGRIGSEVSRLARAFGMDVIAYDPYLTEDQIAYHGAKKVELEYLLRNADFISLHVPLLPSTRNLIGEDAFSKMKETAYLVNCARGGVVDEKALITALRRGQIAGAALDVFEQEPPSGEMIDPLLTNLILTPHLGASTVEGQRLVGIIAAEEVIRVLNGKRPRFQVNKF